MTRCKYAYFFAVYCVTLQVMLIKDQLGKSLHIKERPKRIISLVPSQSEFLWDIGIRNELLGISKFCIHPDIMFKSKARVGGTKDLDLDKIRSLKPDLIIGNKEENEKNQIETLQKEFNVWMSDVYNFEDAFAMMSELGSVLDKANETRSILDKLSISLPKIKNIFNHQKVAYFIWNKPYMFAGKNTFIDFILKYVGLTNTLGNLQRYPELNKEELTNLNPEYCLLSSEPFPFSRKHINEIQGILPKSKLIFVDGEMFSWYGSRLLHLERYLYTLKENFL